MRKFLPGAVLLLVLGVAEAPAQQYGWPPPNYSVTGVPANGGPPYRGLCQILRERGWGGRLRRNCVVTTAVMPDDPPPRAVLLPAQPVPPSLASHP